MAKAIKGLRGRKLGQTHARLTRSEDIDIGLSGTLENVLEPAKLVTQKRTKGLLPLRDGRSPADSAAAGNQERAAGLPGPWVPAVQHWGAICFVLGAYFAACVPLVAAWGRAGDAIEAQFRLSQFSARMIAIIPLGLFLSLHGGPKAYAHWKKRHTLDTGRVPDDYFRTVPYTSADQATFRRADGAERVAYRWLSSSNERLLYFTGESGTGKSSLLAAYLLPKLVADTDARFILLGRRADAAQHLRDEVGRAGAIWAAVPPLPKSARRILEFASKQMGGRRLLVVVDQFEQVLVEGGLDSRRRSFLRALVRSLVRRPLPNVTLVLVVRKDYTPFLHDFGGGGLLPELRENANWQELKPFLLQHAHAFLNGSGLPISVTLRRPIFRQIAAAEDNPDFVRPVTLNIIGLMLVRKREEGVRYLLNSKDAGGLLHAYVRQSIREADSWGCARAVLARMIGPERSRVQATVGALATSLGLPEGTVIATLNQLSGAGLVHNVDAENRAWEITHDFVSRLLDETLRTWRRTTLEIVRRVVLPASLAAAAVFVLMPHLAAKPWYMIASSRPHPVGGEMPLHFAAYMQDAHAARWLLDRGANVEVRTKEHERTPLMYAVMLGTTEMLDLLKAHHADVRASTHDGETALHLATWYEQRDAVQWLLDRNADVNAFYKVSDENRFTALHYAAMKGNVELIDDLIEHGADVDASANQTFRNGSPLAYALAGHFPKAAKALLKAHASSNLAQIDGKSPLHMAIALNDAELISLLIDGGADLDASNEFGQTAREAAMATHNEQLIAAFSRKSTLSATMPTTTQPTTGPSRQIFVPYHH